ncbi:Mechanosensitive ion channel-domain-containing protein [Calycina marina]|uniref:Mechanosensitive ion channel protein n=1 Tax=Calycina marina TaxID=1763456 RepID=A0A9P7YYR5_9HELO|nr:Mechanosensitive ion channel-domain-containing protein [Calycina marina]
MSLRSPRTPSFNRTGFQTLPNNNDTMNYDSDIPLSNVKTNSSTGARKQGDEAPYQESLNNEKSSLFHRNARPKAGGRRRTKVVDRTGTDGEQVKMNGLGKLYNKIVNFSAITRYMVFVLPVALILAVPIVLFALLTDAPAEAGDTDTRLFVNTGMKGVLFWGWIEIIWVSVWISKLVANLAPWIFMALCGVVSSGTRKYAEILRAVEVPLTLVFWAVSCLTTFTALTSTKLNGTTPGKWVTVMKNLLIPALIGSLILLVEKVTVQMLSISYHKRSFSNRIRESKGIIFLLGLLYDASRALFPMYCLEFAEEDYIINDSIEALLAKKTGQSGTATPLKLIGKVGVFGDKLTSAFGNIATGITGREVFNPNSAHSIVVEALEKTKSSEALAKRLWMSFVVEANEALVADDLIEVLGPARRQEADEAFSALDNDGNGDISLEEMVMKVVEVGRDRKAITASMRDVGQAIGVLDKVVSVIIFVIIVFVFVAFQNSNFVTTLATAGTTLLSLSFVFATSVQEFLGSCIFLFIKHPFDVGDRVDIDGKLLVVEQISLLYTIFKRIDTNKLTQSPNIILNNLWVENITRSKAMKEQLDMFISFDTSLEDIELLRSEMEAFVRDPDNSRDFQPDIILEATGIGNMDKLQLKVEIRHKSNWHNETVRAVRRSKFMCALVLALRKVPIYAPGGGSEALGGPNNPGYSVAISNSDAEAARDAASKAKEDKRLVPTKPTESPAAKGDLGSASESQAYDSLTVRNPMHDSAHKDEDAELRNTSFDRQRGEALSTPRSDMMKRASTRGRRRAGESALGLPDQMGPNVTLTYPSPRLGGFEPAINMGRPIDEEAELGMNAPTSSNSMIGVPYAGAGTSAYTGAPGHGAFPSTGPSQLVRQQTQPQSSQTQNQQGGSASASRRRLSLNFKPSSSRQDGAGA